MPIWWIVILAIYIGTCLLNSLLVKLIQLAIIKLSLMAGFNVRLYSALHNDLTCVIKFNFCATFVCRAVIVLFLSCILEI